MTLLMRKPALCIPGGAERGGLFGTHICTMTYIGVPHPQRFLTIYGAGSVEKKIYLYNIHVHNPEGCCFIMCPDLVRSV